MRNVSRVAIAALAAGLMVAGCAQKRATPAARSAPTPPPTVPPQEEAVQEKTPKKGEVSVFVDGKQVGVLRVLELPAGLKTRTVDLGDGYKAHRWAFTDYAVALGIDVKKIKALHLHGGRATSLIDGAELLREGDGLRFAFQESDHGKAHVIYPAGKINTNTTVDFLTRVAFYVEKEPPHLDDRRNLVMPDGKPVGERGPYIESDSGSGTRVYVDGQLVGAVKRKKLTNDLLVSGEGEDPRFSLAGYESTLGVDGAKAKAVDLVAGDDVVARMSPDDVKGASFSVPRKNQGKILVDVPQDGGAKATAKVTSVQIFVKTKPPTRTVVAVGDAPEASPSHASGSGGGSDDEEL